MSPDPLLIQRLLADRLIADGQEWAPLTGGQTNQLWRVGDAVVKRFAPGDDNPRFPNDPAQEVAVLQHLHGAGVAQTLRGRLRHAGQVFLVFAHLDGSRWQSDAAQVARLLRRVHVIPPLPEMRAQPGGSAAIETQVQDILPQLPAPMAKRLSDARPVSAEVPPSAKRALLHGDPVPGNILVTPDGLRLIDWQCPAVGDPVEDLALFLSPAMQLIYRGAPLTRAEGDAFTAAYADPQVQDRLNAMQPWHHWAMAAYCAWKAARGAQRYAQAMELELAALEQNL
jgi:aminoglycoside phosphotransferase (APT) family kinase protein